MNLTMPTTTSLVAPATKRHLERFMLALSQRIPLDKMPTWWSEQSNGHLFTLIHAAGSAYVIISPEGVTAEPSYGPYTDMDRILWYLWLKPAPLPPRPVEPKPKRELGFKLVSVISQGGGR